MQSVTSRQGRPGAGFYLHLDPAESFAGSGSSGLTPRPRTACGRRSPPTRGLAPGDARSRVAGPLEVRGEQLKRVPTAFDRDHESGEDLRREGWGASASFTVETRPTPSFLDESTRLCQDLAPLLRFLCRALDLEFEVRRPDGGDGGPHLAPRQLVVWAPSTASASVTGW